VREGEDGGMKKGRAREIQIHDTYGVRSGWNDVGLVQGQRAPRRTNDVWNTAHAHLTRKIETDDKGGEN